MKKTIILLTSLLIIILLILPSFTFNKNEKTIDLNNLPTQKSNINKIDVKEKINQFYSEDVSLEIESLNHNIIYGSAMNQEFITVGLWKYNIEDKSFNYYFYNFNNRVWSYVIENETIYYITVEKNDNQLFKWKLIKSDLNFSNRNEIDEGVIYNDNDTPFFRKDEISNNIILYSVKDNISIDSNSIITTYQSEYSISIFENGSFNTIIKETGDHINKSGKFSCNAFTNLNIYNNNIVYCNVSYYGKETIKLLNLKNNENKILYENKDLNNWSLSMTKCNENNCVLSFDNKKVSEKNKMINISLEKNDIYIINSFGYKRPEIIKNNKFIIFTNDNFTTFSVKKNEFINKIDIKTDTFINFKTNNNDKLIVEDKDNEFYIIKLK